MARCLGRGPVDGVVERALLGPLACGVPADAVDLFEEIWSYVQKISLKNLWIPENKYQRDLWTSMDKYALNGQWGGQLGAPYAATAHSFLFRVGADPDFRHRCRHHRHRD